MSFTNFTAVKAARKEHPCLLCRGRIAVGSAHTKVAAHQDGDFYAYRVHDDCQAALNDYMATAGLYGDESPGPFGDWEEPDDIKWLAETYPDVAKRTLPSLPSLGGGL